MHHRADFAMNPDNITLAGQAHAALLAVISGSDLPVGVRIRSGDMLLIDGNARGEVSSTIVSQEHGGARRFDPQKIPTATLLQIIEDGSRGGELKAKLASNPPDIKMSEYRELKAALQNAGMTEHVEILRRHQLKVQDDDGILGKIYREPAADGYAYYMVTQVRPAQVRLNSLPVHDGYTSSHLGDDAWTESARIQASIEADRAASGRQHSRRGP